MSAPLHPGPDSQPKSAFSWKGLLVGALFSLFIGIAAPYGAIILQGSWWGFNSSSPGAICSFFVLTFGVNVLAGLIGRQHSLKKADLVMVYAMLLMAVSVSIAFVGYLIPHISGVYYYATAANNWSGIFFPHIPKWLAPQDFEAVKDLYEGLPPGAGMPWEAWLKPLACWYGFYLVLSFTMICMGVVLRRQWSHHERLAYPMTQLPIGMIEGMDGPLTRIPSFFKNRMMWLGFLLPFSLLSLSGMNHYIPEVPDVPFFLGDLRLFDLVRLEFAFSCAWVGFSYLVHLNVTFSIWFFYLLSGYKSNKVNWLQRCSDWYWELILVSNCKISTFSNSETVKSCRISARRRSTCSCFLTMATSTYVLIAIQVWVLTAFSEVPKNPLICRWCLIHLKNNSTCQRHLYNCGMVKAGRTK